MINLVNGALLCLVWTCGSYMYFTRITKTIKDVCIPDVLFEAPAWTIWWGHRFSFGVHPSTVSRNFHRILDVMFVKTAELIKWPERDVFQETMPMSFWNFFKKCCVIIDCTEVFIEQPSDLLARAQVWNNYKHHSTVKFLIGITP